MQIEQRFLDAFNTLSAPRKGSIWFINESVWATMNLFVPKRKGHPGLVFAGKHYTSLHDTVPVLVGTSKNNSGFQVSRVFGDASNKKHTYFSAIRPCSAISMPDSSPAFAVQGFTGFNPDIQRNQHKPSLDEDEMRKLDEYLEKKGLHI